MNNEYEYACARLPEATPGQKQIVAITGIILACFIIASIVALVSINL